MIRAAERRDLPRLRDIERAAGAAFRDVDMVAIADDDPPTVAALQQYQAGGRARVATDDSAGDDVAVAYLLLDVVDEAAHVEQVSVDPSHAHRGLGRQLIETAAGWAAEHGFDVVTLTTFAEVPWNAPHYARIGFTVVPEAELGPGLSAVRRHERESGLDAWPRVSMRRAVRTQDVVDDRLLARGQHLRERGDGDAHHG
ncbi:GNAT family N-acetyltransferase [Kineococcus indalonis]|uniref:GNAT family N-acetyltransferase n=1 Tax=Kineococcus indalonis TaxID=2696566 RepID=UPI001411BF35|nr:GNAT family N-acetyltransferase [Kineococcus indalonis]